MSGTPRVILQCEGGALLAAALLAYGLLGGGWGWFALAFLLPDVSMLGYLAGPRRGAAVYNLAHTTLPPAALGAAGWAAGHPPVEAAALIWLAHIGFDRMLGYGLKYPTGFRHTHLAS
jgi:hypothetical protein